jgi:hypothetical protein
MKRVCALGAGYAKKNKREKGMLEHARRFCRNFEKIGTAAGCNESVRIGCQCASNARRYQRDVTANLGSEVRLEEEEEEEEEEEDEEESGDSRTADYLR